MSWRQKSYDQDLPALAVRGKDLRQSLRIVTIAWMYGVVWMTCISGDQMRSFCKMLGFDDFAFGLMTAIPYVASLGQLVAAVIVERTGLRKHLFMDSATAHRLLWLAVAAVPLVGLRNSAAVWTVLSVVLVSNFLAQLSAPAWWTWMGDLIPRSIRGRYFARRNQITSVVQIVVIIGISMLLDQVTVAGKPETMADQPLLLWTICGVLAVGALFGAKDILLFRKIREVMPPIPEGRDPRSAAMFEVRRGDNDSWLRHAINWISSATDALLIDPMRDRTFRNYVIYMAVITFSATVGMMFFFRCSTEWLGFSKLGTNVLFMVIGPVAATVTSPWWGKLTDKWGRRPVLWLSTFCMIVSIVPWLLATRATPSPQFIASGVNWLSQHLGRLGGVENWTWVAPDSPVGAYLLASLACVLGGMAWTGLSLAQQGIILGFSDGQGRSKFVAASTMLISVGGIIGSLAGGTVAEWFKGLLAAPIRLGPLEWTNWHLTFMLAMLARMVSLAFLVKMPDPGAKPVMDMVRSVGENMYNAVVSRLFYPLRVFGWGRDRDDRDGVDEDREEREFRPAHRQERHRSKAGRQE